MSEDLLSAVAAVERLVCALQGLQFRLLDAFDAARSRSRWVAAEVALALSISESVTQRRIALATALVNRLPNCLSALENGEIDAYKASKIADATAFLSAEDALTVDETMASRLVGKNAEGIRRAANRVVAATDPDGYARRCAARRSSRELRLQHRGEGMSALVAELPAEVASAIYARIDAAARRRKKSTDGKTLDQLRADVFAERRLGNNGCDGECATRADVFVHIDASTLLRLNDNPALLAGHGPIPAELARQIGHRPGSTWRRIVTDPVDGQVISVGRRKYRPPAALDDLVRVRDRECRFPGCRRPAPACEVDHATPWASGGETSARTLIALCAKHHHLKDQPGWAYDVDGTTGGLTVTTPAGDSHRSALPAAS